MRVLPIVASGITLAVIAGGISVTAVGASHQSAFQTKADSLRSEWNTDQSEGVPAASLAPLRQTLDASQYSSGWWSPYWWGTTGQATLSDLETRTTTAWSAAMAASRSRATAQITAWASLEQQLGQYVPAAATASAKTWQAQLSTATTPKALDALATQWAATVAQVTQTAQEAQQTAQVNAAVAGDGGVAGLIAIAQKAVSTAQDLNLDTGQVPQQIQTVQAQVGANQDASAAIHQLLGGLTTLESLIAFNNTVAGDFRPAMLLVDQALAQGDPDAATLQARYQAASGALRAAATQAQLQAVQSQITQVQSATNTSLTANQCGHNVGSGKVITVNLTVQEIVFYQDGCVVQAAPVTTGRALLRTPTGTFHIFYKQSPFQFISPWPKSSPFYYYPSWTSWVMEFAGGGYFIHDAPWEPNWEFGPGSEDSGGASHGCIHVPSTVMQWAYSWTPEGTPVIISS